MKSKTPCRILQYPTHVQLYLDLMVERFATVFQHGGLSVEIYAPTRTDPQKPHTRDEVYFVAAGTGEYVCGDTRQSFGPTDLLFAAAGVEHRFENFTDDLTVWVLFYGPEGGEENG